MTRTRCLIVAAALLATGCSPIHQPDGFLGKLWRIEVGPQYERPTVDTPKDFRGRLDPGDAASFADLPWWQVFGDPTLHGLIAGALEGNYDLQAAVARIDQARAQIGVAASRLFPQIGYEGTAARARTPGGLVASNIPGQTFDVFVGAFDVAWEIDLWGRIRRSTEVARARYLGNDEARRGVVVSLVSEVARNYFELLELDRELAIARESADTYRQTLDVFTKRYQGGTDTRISTSRAEANVQASLSTIAALERQIAQQENAISVLLGTNPKPIDRGMPLVDQPVPVTPTGLTSELLRRRPDIREAEQAMIGANAGIGVAIADFFPTIGLSTLYGGGSNKIGNVARDGASLWNIAANLSGPIFQGGRLYESYQAQKAYWDETIADYRSRVVQAFREVADALAAEDRLVAQRAAQEAQVAALRNATQLSLARYGTGLTNYIEVLDAEDLLYPAESALAQTRRDQLVAVVNLYKALGGGWAAPGEQVAAR